MVRESEVLRQSLRGLFIQFTVLVSTRGLGFAVRLVLVRLLIPEQFGLVAFVNVIIELLWALTSVRVSEKIIQTQSDRYRMIDTSFTLQMALSLVFLSLIMVLSPQIAAATHKPEITPFLRAWSLIIVYHAFRTSVGAILYRDLSFRLANIPPLADAVVTAGVTLLLAFLGLGAWSLIWGPLAGAGVAATVLWAIVPYRPRLRLHGEMLRELFFFSWPLYVFNLFLWVFMHADDFMVGFLGDNKKLGYYTVAFYFPIQLLQLRVAVSAVSYPVFSRIRDDSQNLLQAFNRATKYTALLYCALAAIAIPLARPIILHVLGEEWLPATNPFIIFMGLLTIRAIWGYWGDVFTSVGKTKTLAALSSVNPLLLLALGPPLFYAMDITGMALATLVPLLIHTPLITYFGRKIIRVDYFPLLWRPATALALSAGVGFLLKPLATSLALLVLTAVVILATYAIIALALDRGILREARGYLKTALGPTRSKG